VNRDTFALMPLGRAHKHADSLPAGDNPLLVATRQAADLGSFLEHAWAHDARSPSTGAA
jgi:hypothetical protein